MPAATCCAASPLRSATTTACAPVGGETLAQRAADARAATGDDDDLVLNLHVRVSPRLSCSPQYRSGRQPVRQCRPMNAPPPLNTWSALRHPAFRALWHSGGLYFVANAMQTMAAAWMMVELTGSSFLAALVQTAVFLPMFLLSLPAGVLADITDRRRLILGALAVQAVTGTPAGGAAVCRRRRAGDAAVLHLRRRRLHGDAVAGVELHRRRFGSARRAAQRHHRGVDRLQRRARGRPGAGRRGVRRWPAAPGTSSSRCWARW